MGRGKPPGPKNMHSKAERLEDVRACVSCHSFLC